MHHRSCAILFQQPDSVTCRFLQVILSIPEDMAVTCLDAEKQELIGPIASEQGCGELVALTLWLIAERAKGPASSYAALIATLPVRGAWQGLAGPHRRTSRSAHCITYSTPARPQALTCCSTALLTPAQERTNSPLLWPDALLEAQLRGSDVLSETRSRVSELKRQWQALNDTWFSKDMAAFKPGGLGWGDAGAPTGQMHE